MSKNTKSFSRTKEDFTCMLCGAKTRGTGYTDHCPKCLTSLHVDINPGDRQAECKGLMRPISYDPGKNSIYYRCEKCGRHSRVKASEKDDRELLLELTSHPLPSEATSSPRGWSRVR